ncbi:MAG: phosphatase PAP2 family protein [Sediminibacterium sp. Gen4]|jgi:membrane-associated phospholipid phosphatase|uniref:phosphatase PAP2 family protein n=1 Tax=unclassified Sediminibacterium TaxID=2635961 RepID=UPI0015BF4D1F|nr:MULTISPECIES: phosphatase PAP2 family protein [unclassified Sediminibacterium]MBW0160609.1 phosphatase PAP2 family protein [Sediminibacterium sp.]MBW0164749.1 phosphatase PAP2 family protein [Sediminibacterium sp.]NWK65933.1 phosphatase PAP2 family protein [Sediminibacterium sp. Gen4]
MVDYFLLQSFFHRLLQTILEWDSWLFLKINTILTHPLLDKIFPLWRDSELWVPFYLFLIVLAIVNFGKKAGSWILFAIINVALTDQASSSLIKNWFARIRPCNEELLVGKMRLLLEHCSGGFSFTSSHATNHFGFAMFVFLTTRHLFGKWGKWLFVWAATISYGQVYVGVHYPIDIVFGALLGSGIGALTAGYYNRKIGPITLSQNETSLAQ